MTPERFNIVNGVAKCVSQNNCVQRAINELKSITHYPLDTGVEGQGFSEEDRDKVREFINWLEERRIDIYPLFK